MEMPMAQAETETNTNVTPLRPTDPTNAERQRRHRAKKKRPTVTRSVTPKAPRTVTETVTVERRGSVTVTAATLVAALSLATCSAAFSISGLTSIFAGAFWAVIGLGIAFEIGKLSAVVWLGQRNGARTLRFACVGLVAVLMALNSIGVYGFLSRAHIEHALAGDLTVASKAADVEARLGVQAGIVADLDRRVAQIDTAIEQDTAHGRGRAAMVLADAQRKNRADLVAARTAEAGKLATLKVEKAAVDGERKAVEADLGPVRYLATLIGAPMKLPCVTSSWS
jgi:hypothetical protein